MKAAPHLPTSHTGIERRSRRRGFSLIEVVIAMGMVSFVMMTIVGLLPVGLKMAQESRVMEAKANIVQHVRGMLQHIPFESDTSGATRLSDLPNLNLYFSEEGLSSDEGDAFYRVAFNLREASIQAPSDGEEAAFNTTSARTVIVTMEYPMDAPVNARQRSEFSLFSANQGAL